MAITNFKKIEERRGYLVEDEDRQIFEKEISKSNFGLGAADMIEFILYDSSDNQLPQGDSGQLVRYININDIDSQKYFLVSKNEFTKKANDAPELVVDIEQLIKDAGYDNGIFKTQITLLNRRVGKEEIQNDKLWIHEISPSRTEIRVLPIKNTDNPSEDLLRRYDVFTQEREFRDDTIYYIREYVNSIDVEKIFEKFLLTKGTISKGEKYSTLIKKEFKVDSIEVFFTRVKRKFTEAMNNFVEGNVYQITDTNYGKPRQGIDLIELSIREIKNIISNSLFEVIDYYLPKRNIQEKTILTPEQQITFDEITQILKTTTSNSVYDSDIPDETKGQIRGCTDSEAENYNPLAQVEDGSCVYREIRNTQPEIIKGCTDSDALNFNEFATDDDGSCKYDTKVVNPPTSKLTKRWYVWSETARVTYKIDGKSTTKSNLVEYDNFTITYDENTLLVIGDVREIPKPPVEEIRTIKYFIHNITHQFNEFQFPEYSVGERDSYSNDSREVGQSLSVSYVDVLGKPRVSSYLEPGQSTTICAKEGSISRINGLRIIENGSCGDTNPPPDISPSPTRGSGPSDDNSIMV